MAKKKTPTKAEKKHMSLVADMGCIACEKIGYFGTPAELHHIREGQGGAQRASNYEVIPLCPHHHRVGGYGEAFHAGQQVWESKFGAESDLLIEVSERAGVSYD